MPDEKVIPTLDEIRATFEAVRHKIACMDLCLDATIDDYPIGRRERGKCRLQVERAAGKGYRTVRTTTNKFGRWCAPKKSTYRNSVYVVVRDYDEEHQVVWLGVRQPGCPVRWGSRHVQYANGDGSALAKCWRNDAPRREDHHYTSAIAHVESRHHRRTASGPRRPKSDRNTSSRRLARGVRCVGCLGRGVEDRAELLLDVWKRRDSRAWLILNDHKGHGRPILDCETSRTLVNPWRIRTLRNKGSTLRPLHRGLRVDLWMSRTSYGVVGPTPQCFG